MKDFNVDIIGKRIRELRVGLGLSQQELAEKIHANQNTISQYEKGKARPSIEILFFLAIYLETTADYLLGLEN